MLTNHFLQIFIFLLLSFSTSAQNSLLWEISANGLEKPSYIFGTVHLNDPKFLDLDPSVSEALNKTDMFAMELVPDSIDMLSLMGTIIMTEGNSIKEMLPDEYYRKIKDFFDDEIGIPIVLFDNVYPLFLTFMFMDDYSVKKDTLPILDIYLYKLALEKGKKIRALEKPEEQIDAITSIPVSSQIEILKSEIANLDSNERDMLQFIELYRKADLDGLLKASYDYSANKSFHEELIVKRNKTMFQRCKKLMQSYPVFIAVGALHLPGGKGLLEFFRNDGYAVKAIMPESEK
ncbi:MAG: TraB/GumN family protein [Chitinophagales bacterium]|nr:TraB/GumN family protein [Chitinophagales bacterium]